MKKLLVMMMIALLGLAAATSAHARSTDPYTVTLARQVAWQQQHIEQLEQRRAYLHRYIVRLRNNDSTPTASSSASYSSSPSISGCLSDSQIAEYARSAGFPESVIPTMVDIAAHRGPSGTGESGGCPWKINSTSGACGLWQIYPAQPGCTDPATNARLAYEKYRKAGLSPWE